MNEGILLKFRSKGEPLRVVDFDPKVGVVFGDLADASAMNIAVGVQAVMPGILKPVQQRHHWRPDQFNLDVKLDSGMLLFSGAENDLCYAKKSALAKLLSFKHPCGTLIPCYTIPFRAPS